MPRRFSLKPHYIKQVYSKVYSFQVFKVLIKYSRLSGQIRISYLIPSLETTRRNAIQHEARLAQRYSNDPSLWIMQNESSGVTRCFRLPVCEIEKRHILWIGNEFYSRSLARLFVDELTASRNGRLEICISFLVSESYIHVCEIKCIEVLENVTSID